MIHSITKEMDCGEQEHGAEKSYLIPFSWSISDVLWNHLCNEQDAEFLTNLAYIYYDIETMIMRISFSKGIRNR